MAQTVMLIHGAKGSYGICSVGDVVDVATDAGVKQGLVEGLQRGTGALVRLGELRGKGGRGTFLAYDCDPVPVPATKLRQRGGVGVGAGLLGQVAMVPHVHSVPE